MTSTDTTAKVSSSALARRRRAEAFKRNWRLFRSHRSGMFGLGLLLFFIGVAVFAPVLADPDGLDITKATGRRARRRRPASTGSAPTTAAGRS